MIIAFAAVVLAAHRGLLLTRTRLGPLRARRDAEPRDGGVRRRAHRARRHAGRSAWARASRGSPAARSRRSATSGPTSARRTSSIRSWSWCWAAWASSPAPSTRRSGLGFANKFLENVAGRGARQDRGAGVHHRLHPEAPAGPVRAQGTGGGSMIGPARSYGAEGAGSRSRSRRAIVFVVFPVLNLVVPPGNPFHVSAFGVTLGGKIMCYMIVAHRDGPGVGLRGHPLARARALLRARRLRVRHVPHAPDRRRRAVPHEHARLHGVPRLEGSSRGTGGTPTASSGRSSSWSRCRACSPSCSATSRSARA